MIKYIAVDSGKFETKVAVWYPPMQLPQKCSFRTLMEEGQFHDDSLLNNTYLARIDGNVYKIGNGASGEAELMTSKMTPIHRACILTAIAKFASDDGTDEFHVAIGTPVSEFKNSFNRRQYKYYILTNDRGESMAGTLQNAKETGCDIEEPKAEEFEIEFKESSIEPVKKRKFKIISRHVYPESAGVLYMNLVKYKDAGTVGVIDIGGSTAQGVLYENFEPALNRGFFCIENGGAVLAKGLAAKVTSEFSRIDECSARKLIHNKPEYRYLQPNSGDENYKKEIRSRSQKVIHDYLVNYMREIQNACNAAQWPLDFMTIAFMGGTANVTMDIIHEVFGNGVEIVKESKFANALGFLKRLYGTYNKGKPSLPVTEEQIKSTAKKAAEG